MLARLPSMTNMDLWIASPPSRKLRKLYAELAAVDGKIAAVRISNPVPEHAPSSYQCIRRALIPLEQERWRILARILRIQEEA